MMAGNCGMKNGLEYIRLKVRPKDGRTSKTGSRKSQHIFFKFLDLKGIPRIYEL